MSMKCKHIESIEIGWEKKPSNRLSIKSMGISDEWANGKLNMITIMCIAAYWLQSANVLHSNEINEKKVRKRKHSTEWRKKEK